LSIIAIGRIRDASVSDGNPVRGLRGPLYTGSGVGVGVGAAVGVADGVGIGVGVATAVTAGGSGTTNNLSELNLMNIVIAAKTMLMHKPAVSANFFRITAHHPHPSSSCT
jgi:hypothetical protein